MLEFSEPEIRSRRECLARIGKDIINPTIIIYIMIGALVVVLLMSIYIFIKKFRKFASGGCKKIDYYSNYLGVIFQFFRNRVGRL